MIQRVCGSLPKSGRKCMSEIETLFKNRSFDFFKLKAFGFVKEGTGYRYVSVLGNTGFEVWIVVTEDGKLSADVFDCETGEPYVLVKVPQAEGAFVGKVRTALAEVLEKIARECCRSEVFKALQAKKVIAYIKRKYGDEPEFLWQKFSGNAIVRRQDNNKWYAAFLKVRKNKLGLSGDDEVEILDLRAESGEIERLADGEHFFRGYHMNKKHWLTIVFDGFVPVEEICRRVDESYELAKR